MHRLLSNTTKNKRRLKTKSKIQAERQATAKAMKFPELQAVQKWQDIDAEIKLKTALENLLRSKKIPALIIRSLNLKSISALNDLGLKLPGDAEIDLITVYISGDSIHILVCEVKRSDTYPWQTKSRPPNSRAR